MPRHTPKRAALLLAAATIAAFGATTAGSSAATIPANPGCPASSSIADNAGCILQLGDGYGRTRPLAGLDASSASTALGLQTVLFDANRFAYTLNGNITQRPGYGKFLGWTTVTSTDPTGAVQHQVAMTMGGDDGRHWDAPRPATIQNVSGQAVPFTLEPHDSFAVMFDSTSSTQAPFRIYYLVSKTGGVATSIADLHTAQSIDGVQWVNDTALTETHANTVIGGSFAPSSYGPSQVIFQPKGSTSCANTQTTFPWTCRFVMVYDATGPSGEQVALAGSGNGTAFDGLSAPALSVGAPGAFDEYIATMANVSKLNGQYFMTYSGGMSGAQNGCDAGNSGCFSIGTATSGDGIHWSRAGQPAISHELIETYAGTPDHDTLYHAVPVNDGSAHLKVFYNLRDNTGVQSEWLASSTPTPAQGPTLTFASPAGPQKTAGTPVSATLTDTVGSAASTTGVDLSTVDLRLDVTGPAATTGEPFITGTQVGGWAEPSPSLVGSLGMPAYQLTLDPRLLVLPDGPHTLTLEAQDLDGNWSATTTSFLIDTTAPVTALTGSLPSSPAIGFPGSIGTVHGETTDATTPITRIQVTVTNPIGQTENFYSSDPYRLIHSSSTDGKTWDWAWIAPSSDPFYAVPGTYTISGIGIDSVSNVEPARARTCGPDQCIGNTFTITVI